MARVNLEHQTPLDKIESAERLLQQAVDNQLAAVYQNAIDAGKTVEEATFEMNTAKVAIGFVTGLTKSKAYARRKQIEFDENLKNARRTWLE
jgi:hypothetical protein